MTYLATFFSHFGATGFRRYCNNNNIPCKIMPVPRSLSSSCGSCVKFESSKITEEIMKEKDIEGLYEILEEDKYKEIYMN